MPVLDRLEFQSGNALYRPVIDAIQIIKENRTSNQHFYAVMCLLTVLFRKMAGCCHRTEPVR